MKTALLLAASLTLTSLAFGEDDQEFKVVSHADSDATGKSAFSFQPSDFKGDPASRSKLPIGVFDSGIGGLTVLEAILTSDNYNNDTLRPGPDGRPDFENESFIYFGDQANMPYGNYSAEEKTATLREHILKDTVFLMGRRYWKSADSIQPSFDKQPVKAVVIACNTATAYGLEDIRGAMKQWDVNVPVIGVVEAGARGVQAIWKEKQNEAVAVFATTGTCSSGAYPRLMQSTLGRAGYGPATITQHGSVTLAGVLEGAPQFQNHSVKDTIQADIHDLLVGFRDSTAKDSSPPKPIGTVVLGCTHFPLAQTEIDNAFSYWKDWKNEAGERPWFDFVADNREFVDPATWTSKELFRELAKAHLRSKADKNAATREFYLSVPKIETKGIQLADKGAFAYDYKYGREPNQLSIEDTKIIPLNFDKLPATGQKLITEKLPVVLECLTKK